MPMGQCVVTYARKVRWTVLGACVFAARSDVDRVKNTPVHFYTEAVLFHYYVVAFYGKAPSFVKSEIHV